MARLRLATYNLRDLLDDVEALTEVLAALSADVVCVQEVPRHLVGDVRTARLARRSGYTAPRTHTGSGGTTVLWGPRTRVDAVQHLPLRVPVAQRRRGCAVLDGRVDGVGLRVVSLHLGLHTVQRRRHAVRLSGLLAGRPRAVVAGDANEPVEGPAVRALGLDVLGSAPPTFPATRPEHAIDVVLGRGWRVARELPVPVADDVLARASDHRPRLLELEA